MATITKTIGSGKDYSTIATWEADLDNDTPYDAADDVIGTIDEAASFTDDIAIDGGGTLGLNSIKLTVNAAYRHDGTDASGADCTFGNGEEFYISTPINFTLEWLIIDSTSATFSADDSIHTNTAATINLDKCILISPKGAWIYIQNSSTTVTVINCIGYQQQTASARASIQATTGTVNIYNCTFHENDNTTMMNAWAGATTTVKNTIAMDSTNTNFNASWDTSNNNMSEDTTAPGTGSLKSKTPSNQFVSVSGSRDYHLKAGADALGAGADLSGTFTDDIDGDTRSNWDMGADERQVAAGGTAPLATIKRRQRNPLIRM